MFKFGFDEVETKPKEIPIAWYESEQIHPPENILEDVKTKNTLKFMCRPLEIIHVSSNSVIQNLKESFTDDEKKLPILEAEENHSDLVTGKYEGGLKIWECTKDLSEYLLEYTKYDIESNEKPLSGQKVLDLGCGAGIIGIVAVKLGACVTFQDYNREVIENATMPNVALNCGQDGLDSCTFFSGDWNSFLELNNKTKEAYDLIVTSETIYNPENYEKLSNVLVELMKKGGVALVSGKMCYFGVGGSMAAFQAHLDKFGVNHKTCWSTDEGVKRLILRIDKQ